jgi:DNA-directed RNA polymerase subunit RPC12/RpoP
MAYQHKEAFALMWYRCDACGHTERFWNSRDGVTPFGGVQCPSCGLQGLHGGLSHYGFHLDECVPNHKPYPGQRIWRDGTQQEAVAILTRRFASLKERNYVVPDEVQGQMLAEIGLPSSEFQKGWPTWERVKDRVLL